MFEPLTLNVSELAERWNWTPRQVLDCAQHLELPLYFMFDGLAFDKSDTWHRANGDYFEKRELEILRDSIASGNAYILRSARGENGQYEQQLSSAEIVEHRAQINADKATCSALEEKLEERETSRNRMSYRGWMRAGPGTLEDISRDSTTPSPHWAFHPLVPLTTTILLGRGLDGSTPIAEGRLMDLEPVRGINEPRLTLDRLCAMTVEVKAIEAHRLAKQAASEVRATAPAPVLPVAVVVATESKENRQDRRLQACLDAGLRMNDPRARARLPDGIGAVAALEGMTRQAFSDDVRAAMKRREGIKRAGGIGGPG